MGGRDYPKVLRFVVKDLQAPFNCTNEKQTVRRCIYLTQLTITLTCDILEKFLVHFKIDPVILIKAILGGKPQIAYTILGDAHHAILREAVVHRQLAKRYLSLQL